MGGQQGQAGGLQGTAGRWSGAPQDQGVSQGLGVWVSMPWIWGSSALLHSNTQMLGSRGVGLILADHCCYEPSPLSPAHLSFLARRRSEEGPCVLQSRVKEVDDSDEGRRTTCVPTTQTPIWVSTDPKGGHTAKQRTSQPPLRGGRGFLGSGWLRCLPVCMQWLPAPLCGSGLPRLA